MRLQLIITLLAAGISNSVSPRNGITGNNVQIAPWLDPHRVIKRFAPMFSMPRPRLPTISRPSFPFPLFSGYPKGEEGSPTVKGSKGRRTLKRPFESQQMPHEDRTLLAISAKKALLLKKAIIMTKLKKAALKKLRKKAAVAYGINQLSKVKGVSVKAPGLAFSVGSPNVQGTKVVAKVTSEDDDDVEFNSGDDDDDDDDDEELENTEDVTTEDSSEDGSDGTDAIVVTPSTIVGSAAANETLPTLTLVITNNADVPSTTPPPQPETLSSITMMQQLQQQLQQKQQLEVLQQQQILEQQMLLQQTSTPTPDPDDHDPDTEPPLVETYKGSKKGSKKKKKKKGKPKPRPVNLGVKANLYKKFDSLAKQAQNKLSTFIQIDVDFIRRRSSLDIMDPDRFVSRTAEVSVESTEDFKYVNNVPIPGNFIPPWETPVWNREYPGINSHVENVNCGENFACELKPVYLVFRKVHSETEKEK